jgi:hypothetical protein
MVRITKSFFNSDFQPKENTESPLFVAVPGKWFIRKRLIAVWEWLLLSMYYEIVSHNIVHMQMMIWWQLSSHPEVPRYRRQHTSNGIGIWWFKSIIIICKLSRFKDSKNSSWSLSWIDTSIQKYDIDNLGDPLTRTYMMCPHYLVVWALPLHQHRLHQHHCKLSRDRR